MGVNIKRVEVRVLGMPMSDRQFLGLASDCDGVTVDSEQGHFLARKIPLSALHCYDLAERDYVTHMAGLGHEQALSAVVGHLLKTPELRLEFYTKFIKPKYRELQPSLEAIPGIGALYNRAHQAGLVLSMASTQGMDAVELNMQKALSPAELELFLPERIVSAEGLKLPAKPDPAIYLKAAERMGLVPEDCIALEDLDVGVTAAKAAGMFVIGIDNKWSPPDKLFAAGADCIVKGWHEVSFVSH